MSGFVTPDGSRPPQVRHPARPFVTSRRPVPDARARTLVRVASAVGAPS